MSVTAALAERAISISYERLLPETVDLTKRIIIDALACVYGGYDSPTGAGVRAFARETSGSPDATIIGAGTRAPVSAAIVANQGMLRYLDYNDDLDFQPGPGIVGGMHPSGSLPVALAVAEWLDVDGKSLIEAVVAGYEIAGLVQSGFSTSLETRAFHHGSVHTFMSAAIAGKLLRLTAEQIVNAMGIAVSVSVGLDILDAEGEEYVMAKNLADGLLAERGYSAAVLAKHGLTGPHRVIEGNKGFAHVVLGGPDQFRTADFERAFQGRERPYVFDVDFKSMCAEMTTHGHLRCTLALVNEHNLYPRDIQKVTVRTNKRTVRHTGDPVKKFPRNKENADHSSYYLTALAVINRSIEKSIYKESNYASDEVRSMIEKVELVHDPRFDSAASTAEVVIQCIDGRTLQKEITREELEKLHKQDNSSSQTLARKFSECAMGLLPEGAICGVVESCLKLDAVSSVRNFMSDLPICSEPTQVSFSTPPTSDS